MGAKHSRAELHGGTFTDRGVAMAAATIGADLLPMDMALMRGYCSAVESAADHSQQMPVDFWLWGRLSQDAVTRKLHPHLQDILDALARGGTAATVLLARPPAAPLDAHEVTLLAYLVAAHSSSAYVPPFVMSLQTALAARARAHP